jgi:serine protease Do
MSEDRDLKEGNHIENDGERPEEGYRFLSEIHKRRPLSFRTILTTAAGVTCCAVLFGVVAALVFGAVSDRRQEKKSDKISLVSQSEVEESSSKSNPEQNGSSGASDTGNNASPNKGGTSALTGGKEATETGSGGIQTQEGVSGAAGSGTVTGSPTTLTPEEETEQDQIDSLVNFQALNAKMKQIGNDASASFVRVIGIRDAEDWVHTKDVGTSARTGLIVADNGQNLLVLTDFASLTTMKQIAAEMPDGEILKASLVKHDPITDLSVISIPKNTLKGGTGASFRIADLGNSYQVREGDSVIAIGSPLGYSGSVVYGQVTSIESTVSVTDGEYNLITTDILGSPSGNGFLINTDGQVVGLINQKYATQNASVVTGVPISLLKHLIEVLSNKGALSYAGIHGQEVSAEVSKSSGIPVGVYLTGVDATSPALAAGLQVGDILESVDGLRTTSMKLVHNKLTSLKPGDTVPVTVCRLGADGYVKFDFKLTIGESK